MRLLAHMHRVPKRLLGSNVGFSLGVAVVLASLESLGRQATSDLHDSLAALILGVIVLLIGLRHRQSALAWVNGLQTLAGRFAGWARRFTFDIGIDLRGEPPIPVGYPPAVLILSISLVVLGLAGLAGGAYLPTGLRVAGVHGFYLGYLLVLVALWGMLTVAILLAIFFPVALIHDAFVGAFQGLGRRPRRAEWLCIGIYFGGLGALATIVPMPFLMAVCGVTLLLNLVTVLLPANQSVQFLWRPRGGGSVRAIPWARWATGEFALLTLAMIDLILLTCGDQLLGVGPTSASAMPITRLLGTLLAMLAPGVLATLVLHTILGRARDPARPSRPMLHVGGGPPMAHRAIVDRLLTGLGWRVRFGTFVPAEAVSVRLVGPELSQATEFEPRWPLAVSLDDLYEENVRDRLVRRDEIQKRRKVVAALERLFKRAAQRSYQGGNGFWVAPHFWFIAGLTRDEPEENLDFNDGAILSGAIGPPYHRLLSRPTRHYLYQMLRALQVDLIFVEDGVGFVRFRRVLRTLFDVYDRNAGRRRAEDTHFTGIPGTRVLIHEFRIDEPFRSEVYPEPKYDNLGRARILHIFRDRGEQDEPLEPPFDFSRSPAPMAAV